jgi:hypothetical protein
MEELDYLYKHCEDEPAYSPELEELGDPPEHCKDEPAYSLELEFIQEMYRCLDGLRKEMDESKLRAIKCVSFLFVMTYTLSLRNLAATDMLSGRFLKRNCSSTPHQISPSDDPKSPSVSDQAKES